MRESERESERESLNKVQIGGNSRIASLDAITKFYNS